MEAVRLYVQGLSYRQVATTISRRTEASISARAINGWVHQIAARAKSPLEVSTELRPTWSGVLGIDGKAVRLAEGTGSIFIGVDQGTRDVVHALIIPSERGEDFRQLVHEAVTIARYPLRGLVSDAAGGIKRIHRTYFSRAPLQLCRAHFDRRISDDMSMSRGAGEPALRRELARELRGVLFAKTHRQACEKLYTLLSDPRFVSVRGRRMDHRYSLLHDFNLYVAHLLHPWLPADNNITENVIRQLARKLDPMEGMLNLQSAQHYAWLLIGAYRFRPFGHSRLVGARLHSPLELAGVTHPHRDWLSWLLR